MHYLSKLHQNCILTSAVDSYCLLCENYLRSEDEAFTHTEKPIHKKKVEATITTEFTKEQIVKVKKGYYCSICNVYLSMPPKVRIHISNIKHQEKKRMHLLMRFGDYIIAFDEVAITLDLWHGLADNTCFTCNEEIEESNHRNNCSHVLKLVQSKCDFGDSYIYRKVDDDSFFCLTCGNAFAINDKVDHHENASHKNLYDSAKQLKNNIHAQTKNIVKSEPIKTQNKNSSSSINNEIKSKLDTVKKEKVDAVKSNDDKPKITNPEVKQIPVKPVATQVKRILGIGLNNSDTMTLIANSVKASNIIDDQIEIKNEDDKKNDPEHDSDSTKQSEVLDKVDEFQKNGINIDFTRESARCKHCNENIAFDTASIEKHIESHHNMKKNVKKADPKVDTKTQHEKIGNDSSKVDKKENIQTKIDIKKETQKPVNEVKSESKKALKAEKSLINDNPKQELNKQANKTDSNSDKLQVDRFAKENNLLIKSNKAYCQNCNIEIDLNIDAIQAHINLNSHKDKYLHQNGRKSITLFVQKIIWANTTFNTYAILNDRYVLTSNSFHCIIFKDDTYTCVLCNTDFSKGTGQLTHHINESDHKNKLGLCKVLTSLLDEFVREILPGIYHCGYCNLVCYDWSEMQEHLCHPLHRHMYNQAQWDFERFEPQIRNSKHRQIDSLNNINYA